MELIIRSTKHVARTYLQQVDQTCLSSAISHFLNCFLSSCSTPLPNLPQEELITWVLFKLIKETKRGDQVEACCNENRNWHLRIAQR